MALVCLSISLKFSLFSYKQQNITFFFFSVKTVWDELALVFHFILLIICCSILSSDIHKQRRRANLTVSEKYLQQTWLKHTLVLFKSVWRLIGNTGKSALALPILSTSVSALLRKKNLWNNYPKFLCSHHQSSLSERVYDLLPIWEGGSEEDGGPGQGGEGGRRSPDPAGSVWDALRIPLAGDRRCCPSSRRWRWLWLWLWRPCCCGFRCCRRCEGTLAGGASAAPSRPARPSLPRHRPPRAPGTGICPQREVLKAGRKLKDADIFAPPLISSLPPAAILHQRSWGRGWWAAGNGVERVKSCGEREAAMEDPDRCVCWDCSGCHQHHGEKEKLRGPGAGEWPWHPSAHPDLPVEANQVRAGHLGCSCNRAVEVWRGVRAGCCPVAGRMQLLLQLQREGVKKTLFFALGVQQFVCIGYGRRSQGSLT